MRLATVEATDLGHAVEQARHTLGIPSIAVHGPRALSAVNFDDPLISSVAARARAMDVKVSLVIGAARFDLAAGTELVNTLLRLSSTTRHRFASKYGHTNVYGRPASLRLSFVRDVAKELGLPMHFELRY